MFSGCLEEQWHVSWTKQLLNFAIFATVPNCFVFLVSINTIGLVMNFFVTFIDNAPALTNLSHFWGIKILKNIDFVLLNLRFILNFCFKTIYGARVADQNLLFHYWKYLDSNSHDSKIIFWYLRFGRRWRHNYKGIRCL